MVLPCIVFTVQVNHNLDEYARNDGRNIFGAPKALGKKVQTRKGSTGGKKDKKDKKKEKWLKRKNLYLTGSENEEELEGKLKEKSE